MIPADFSRFYRAVHPVFWLSLWLSIRAARVTERRMFEAGYVQFFWQVSPLGIVTLRAAFKPSPANPVWCHDGPRAHELADLDWISATLEAQDRPGVTAFAGDGQGHTFAPPAFALLDPG